MAIKVATSSFDEVTPDNDYSVGFSDSNQRFSAVAVSSSFSNEFTVGATVEFYGKTGAGGSGHGTLLAIGTVVATGSSVVWSIPSSTGYQALKDEFSSTPVGFDNSRLEVEKPWTVGSDGALVYSIYTGTDFVGGVADITSGSDTISMQFKPVGNQPQAIPDGAKVVVNGISKETTYYIYDDLS